MATNYIYLLQEREFIKTKENVYKVGMTKKENHKRFNQYPKGSVLLFQMICNDCNNIEKSVIKIFKNIFIQRKDIGNEYFEGDYKYMIDIIFLAIKNDKNKIKLGDENNDDKINENNENENSNDENNEDENNDDENSEDENNDDENSEDENNDDENNEDENNEDENSEDENNDDENNEDENSEDENNEDDEHIYYQITTYEEWIKCVNINKVIINNKKGEGYIRFNGGLWRKLYDKNSIDFDKDCMEDLLGFIEYYKSVEYYINLPSKNLIDYTQKMNLSYRCKNNITNEIISYEKFNNLNFSDRKNYTITKKNNKNIIPIEFDVNKIYQDILNKCYVKNCEFYNLNYHEYVLSIYVKEYLSEYERAIKPVIFNSLNFSFNNIDELADNKILTRDNKGNRSFYVNNNTIDTTIVDDILNSLINEETKFKYKNLVYNLIVKQEDEQIIFEDFNERLLTTWIKDLLYSISKNNNFIYSSNYYEDIQEYKQNIKKYRPRCVIIDTLQFPINKQIKDFSKFGINIFIVYKDDKKNTIYNFQNFRNYLQDNKDFLMNFLKNQHNFESTNGWESDIFHDDNIFYKSELFLTNFFKWCCIK